MHPISSQACPMDNLSISQGERKSADTTYAKNLGEGKLDVAIHEVFWTPFQLTSLGGQTASAALQVGTQIHTSPPAFGKVMANITPRLAIGYHFYNEPTTRYPIYEQISKLYPPKKGTAEADTCSSQGGCQFTLALDNLVWNITPSNITERVAVLTPYADTPPGPPSSSKSKSETDKDDSGTLPKDNQNNPNYSATTRDSIWPDAACAQQNLVCEFITKQITGDDQSSDLTTYCTNWTAGSTCGGTGTSTLPAVCTCPSEN